MQARTYTHTSQPGSLAAHLTSSLYLQQAADMPESSTVCHCSQPILVKDKTWRSVAWCMRHSLPRKLLDMATSRKRNHDATGVPPAAVHAYIAGIGIDKTGSFSGWRNILVYLPSHLRHALLSLSWSEQAARPLALVLFPRTFKISSMRNGT